MRGKCGAPSAARFSPDSHDYFIKDENLVDGFEGMYRQSEAMEGGRRDAG